MYEIFLTPEDLSHWVEDASTEKLTGALEDVWAQMCVEAPSLSETPGSFDQGLIRSILRQAATRYATSEAGSVTQASEATGPFNDSRTFASTRILTAFQAKQLQQAERALAQQSRPTGLQEAELLTDFSPSDSSLWTSIGWESF